MGGVLTPEVMYKCSVTSASREKRRWDRNSLWSRGREARREGRREGRETTPPSPGEAMIKAVMLRWGPLLGGPLVLPITAALPLLFSILGKLSLYDYFLKHSLLRN